MANADVAVDWQVSTSDTFATLVASGHGHRPLRRRALGARGRGRAGRRRRLLLPVPRAGPHLAGRPHPHHARDRRLRPRPRRWRSRPARTTRRATTPRTGGWPRTSPDLVLHLGDYIYEGGAAPARVRQHVGAEIVSLADYRRRYAQYKSDPDLQAAHAAAPWLVGAGRPRGREQLRRHGARRQHPGADRRAVDRPADRRLPGVLREHAAAAGVRRRAATASRCTAGSAGAGWPPSTCSTPGSSATTRPAATAGRCAPTPTWPRAASPARAQEAWLLDGLGPALRHLGHHRPAGVLRPPVRRDGRGQHGRLGRLPRLARPDPARLAASAACATRWCSPATCTGPGPTTSRPTTPTRTRRRSAPSWSARRSRSGGDGSGATTIPNVGHQPAPAVLLRPPRLRRAPRSARAQIQADFRAVATVTEHGAAGRPRCGRSPSSTAGPACRPCREHHDEPCSSPARCVVAVPACSPAADAAPPSRPGHRPTASPPATRTCRAVATNRNGHVAVVWEDDRDGTEPRRRRPLRDLPAAVPQRRQPRTS